MYKYLAAALLSGAAAVGMLSLSSSPGSVPGSPVSDAVAKHIRGGADCGWYTIHSCDAPGQGRCNEDSPANANVWQSGGNGQQGYPDDNKKVYCANGQSCTDAWTGGMQYCGS